ncbi:autotransporter assembly complex protein TamA [Jannaschia formosa]|uniref:autotransporter assembly complex protein TamA n=1 Tax=Jannaschia formosa TaxID=2259592 RepID=UPI0014316653|nr:autotransporter assembly complex family protein [Jannaschia formosa]
MKFRNAFLAVLVSGAATADADAAEFQLTFQGDNEALAQTIQATSLVANTIREEEDATRREIVAAAQADYSRLLAAMFEAGHFGPVISILIDGVEAAELPVIGTDAPVDRVEIQVAPGPIFLFGEARIGPLPEGVAPPEGFAPGAQAGTDILREATSEGIDAWRARGFAKAELESQEIVARHPVNLLDARLTLDPGQRLSYGPLLIEGNENVRAGQIRRIADLRPGRVFDPEEVRTAARRLQQTGAFRSVAVVEADEALPDATLPLTVQVVERLPRRIGFGAEISTTEGAGLSAFWLHRNLTGFADSFRAEAEITGIGGDSGGEDYRLGFAYNRPATFNSETDLFVTGEVESLDQDDFTSDRAELVVGARRIVSEEFQYSYGLSLEYSDVEDAFGEREFLIASIPLKAQYDRRDEPLNPADGYYVEAGLDPFYGFETAGGGVRFTADLRGYQGFGDDRRTVIAARLQLGTVVGPDLEDTPPTDLFFSGGGGTVRGQPFQSLSLELPSGREVGGRSFVGLSTELRRRVTDTIGVVGFIDAGQISESSDWSGGESHVGAGLGVRYNTGIGPIRVDLGVPVSGPGDNSGFEIYIGIGQAF